MSNKTTNEWTLKELAAETGVPGRTIRFYISRDLVDPPLRAGRGAAYGEKHKSQLTEIRALQAKGLMLAEIAHILAGEPSSAKISPPIVAKPAVAEQMLWFEADGSLNERFAAMKSGGFGGEAAPAPAALPEPENWRSYQVSPDVVVMLRSGTGPWRTKRLLAALRRFAAQVADETKKEDKGE
jgi:DNA-binding transcriptional MerR regulator